MTFANPPALLWGLLAVPVVILYLRRIRLRREPVATSMLWERVFAEGRIRSAWQRWRHPASLAVQLIVLASIVLALADPQIPGPRKIVLIIDNSASMTTSDAEPTRLAAAKRAAERLIAGLRPCDQMAILSAGGAVGVCCRSTSDRNALRKALQEVEGAGSTEVDVAVGLARWILDDVPRGTIQVITDGCFDGVAKLAEADDVELVRVGRRTGNVAITRLAARRNLTDPVKCQVLVEVRNFSDRSVERNLKIELMTGEAIESKGIVLAPDGRWQKVFQSSAPEGGPVVALLDHRDLCTEDDRASLRVPSPSDGRTRTLGPNDFVAGLGLPVAEFSGRGEADLRTPGDVGIAAAKVAFRGPGSSPWLLLVGLGAGLLIVEWCFYQRRWIC